MVNSCSPSSCGVIRNISFPFRLKHDPDHCGYRAYELGCENNVTTVYVKSRKFHVKAINYQNFTIRLGYVSMINMNNNNNTCSFPRYSLYGYNFSPLDPYSPQDVKHYYYGEGSSDYEVAWPINLMSCPASLKNSSSFLDASNGTRHVYIKVGHMNVSDVNQDMCKVDKVVLTSWKFKDSKNVSLSEIHQSLLYGFELSWERYPCGKCKTGLVCFLDTILPCAWKDYLQRVLQS